MVIGRVAGEFWGNVGPSKCGMQFEIECGNVKISSTACRLKDSRMCDTFVVSHLTLGECMHHHQAFFWAGEHSLRIFPFWKIGTCHHELEVGGPCCVSAQNNVVPLSNGRRTVFYTP